MYVLCSITCTLFSARQQNDKENKRARNEEDDDGGNIDDRSEYERDIEVRRHENQVFQHQLGLVSLLFCVFVSTKGIPGICAYIYSVSISCQNHSA